MAIVSYTAIMEDGARSARIDAGTGHGYTVKFRCMTNTQNDGPAAIVAQLGLDNIYGQQYINGTDNFSDDYSYLTGVSVDQVGNDGLEWIVTLNYSWYAAQTIGGGASQNPLLMPIDVSWGWRDYELPVLVDIDGNAALNKAFDPFDPPLLINDPRLTMMVVRNEAQISIPLIQQYRNAINSDAWAGWPPYFAHVLGITPKNVFHQAIGWYYQVTYEFEFITARQAQNSTTPGGEPTGFRFQILNQGLRALDTNNKKYHVTYRGVPVSQPVLLDDNGRELQLQATPTFIEVHAYPELPFATFNFDPIAITGMRTGFNSSGGTGGGVPG